MDGLEGYQLCHLDDTMGSVLREKRLVLQLTMQQVADRAKITKQQYQKFETGERNIMVASFKTACSVVEALEMDITKFYHGDYVIGEEIYIENGELKYKKTGRSVDEDIEDDEILPLNDDGSIPTGMFLKLIMKVPKGKITRWEDVQARLSNLYGIRVGYKPQGVLPIKDSDGGEIPYWRIVQERGTIGGIPGVMSKECVKERLEREGIPIVQRGSMEGSFKVGRFRDFLYDFRSENQDK